MPRPSILSLARRAALLSVFSLLALGAAWAVPAGLAAEDAATVEARLRASIGYLASDELEGRGVGVKGLDLAADYLAEQFAALGLQTDLYEGRPFQQFAMTVSSELGPAEKNRLTLVGPPGPDGAPQRIELKLAADFNPLAAGGSGEFDLPVVFAGYGITSSDPAYDDYAGLDVKGEAVLLIRKQPQQGNPHGLFGAEATHHATFLRKVANAFEHGAAAVILFNDEHGLAAQSAAAGQSWRAAVAELGQKQAEFAALPQASDEQTAKFREEVRKLVERIAAHDQAWGAATDKPLDFLEAGDASGQRSIPVLFATRAALDPVVQAALGKSLGELEDAIDAAGAPHSAELAGWRAIGSADVVRKQAEVRNVIAVLPGEGPLAEETVIVGAHYDHLGYGGAGSLAPWTTEIHNGADDNGSGTAALLEVARQLAARPEKPRRRIVFIAFTAEERGLIGSARYVREPRFPLDKTVAMLNMDMVGRLTENKLIVDGVGTASEWDGLVTRLNERFAFDLAKKPGGYGPSDHASFYGAKIPVLHFFTGLHGDYHRPSDDSDKLNVEGMRRIAELVAETAWETANAEARPTYQETNAPLAARGGDRPYLGTIPDFSQAVEGYALMGVTTGGPAEQAGLKAGDVIVRFGESRIGGLEDIDSALRKFKAGDKVPVVVKRGAEELTFEVELGKPR